MRTTTDIGGTFTDLVYLNESGDIEFNKSDSTPPNFETGIMEVLKKSKITLDDISMFIHGSTVVINTLTERTGAKVGLITTKGTRDVLEIARGNRPDLYNFRYQKPKPFVERYLRLEVDERLNHRGEVLRPIILKEIDAIIETFKKENVESIAISFLHSYKNPVHEIAVKNYIKSIDENISVTASHELIKEWREYERTNTTVLNAYVQPVTKKYINNLELELSKVTQTKNKYVMQSNGGLTSFADSKEYPIHMVESGPVAGVYGSQLLGELINEPNVIAFDVGGTTAKCSLITNSEVKITTEYYIEKSEKTSGYPIKVPVVDIVEIGNGGGSIAWIDELGSLKVGPKSAGSTPGPLSYGKGGKNITTTDANLYIGRLSDKNFSNDVDHDALKKAISEQVAKPFNSSTEDAALGIIEIANSNMLNALKLISVRKGYNPQDFTMIAFGGGGPIHAAQLARDLRMKKVVIPIAASVFSAWGMLMSDIRKDFIQTNLIPLKNVTEMTMDDNWKRIELEATEEFKKNHFDNIPIELHRSVDMRYKGQEHTVHLKIDNQNWTNNFLKDLREKFHKEHEFAYNFKLDEAEIELVNIHLTAFGKIEKPSIKKIDQLDDPIEERALIEVRKVYYRNDNWQDTKVFRRESLGYKDQISGPAIIEEKTTSTLVLKDQLAEIDAYGNIIIEVDVDNNE
ncbi:hydantoinase/oxoprolinase family protein [Phocicoccus pinnipedialis]|uniref:Acetophenone carboxylase gamma subunit n=1 Tax=Phocicoccus pinnipedialis TaxID=110845 RepID=A0A6V7R4H4_9BACL|nr:hydantoinase/oxoprolinase family protein [Jeotgalicoccus pinnipedialis]MBP1939658.1 N-methylhydantoinase A [Jeotgalicoccus pinnipedialis]CAD2072280.1 Acetophenone carboxylase gamma subunit [Jeotgalicoccus pinnipedialis]